MLDFLVRARNVEMDERSLTWPGLELSLDPRGLNFSWVVSTDVCCDGGAGASQ